MLRQAQLEPIAQVLGRLFAEQGEAVELGVYGAVLVVRVLERA
jgi:hypothetical protein